MTVSTASAAIRLHITRRRVTAMIAQGRLPAKREGREWAIEIEDLKCVAGRKPGRPLRVYRDDRPLMFVIDARRG